MFLPNGIETCRQTRLQEKHQAGPRGKTSDGYMKCRQGYPGITRITVQDVGEEKEGDLREEEHLFPSSPLPRTKAARTKEKRAEAGRGSPICP